MVECWCGVCCGGCCCLVCVLLFLLVLCSCFLNIVVKCVRLRCVWN